MRVLFVNHTSEVSGGERSLLDLLMGLRNGTEVVVACPPGRLADMVEAAGIQTRMIVGTAGSLRLHPRHTPRAVAQMTVAAWQIRSLSRRLGIDVVHANSIRAGIIASLAAAFGAPRPVVHLRDILPPGPVTSATYTLLGRSAAVLLANSAWTAGRLGPGLRTVPVKVIHNPVDLDRFDPARVDRRAARARLGLGEELLVTGVIAQLTPWKGQDDAIRAIARVRESHPHIHLLLVGSATFVDRATRYDNLSYVESLNALVDELGVRQNVSFLGDRDDIPDILGACDAVLLPSWEEPFGRAAAEGMAMGVPVLATSAGGPREIIGDGREGFLLPPRDPARWADALLRLIDDAELRRRIGERARARALALGRDAHARSVRAIYDDLITG